MKRVRTNGIAISVLALAGCVTLGIGSANAGCVNKAAQATAESAASAKWFAMETMVQSVSWGLWPAYLADGSVPGYSVRNKRYKCSSDGIAVTCKGQATFCSK